MEMDVALCSTTSSRKPRNVDCRNRAGPAPIRVALFGYVCEYRVNAPPSPGGVAWETKGCPVNLLLALVAIVAVVLLVTGGIASSLNFLIWVGLVLLVIALIVWLTRTISGRRTM